MKIARWDSVAKKLYDDKVKIAAMQVDATKHSNVPFRNKQAPSNSWAMPYVTGKTYRVWWGKAGLDWSSMKFEVSALWDALDKGIYFNIPYVEARAGGFPIRTSSLTGSNSVQQPADTLVVGGGATSGLYK